MQTKIISIIERLTAT